MLGMEDSPAESMEQTQPLMVRGYYCVELC